MPSFVEVIKHPEEHMVREWQNLQILECHTDNGGTATVFLQTDGARRRYVLGNGIELQPNGDGSFTEPHKRETLTVSHI